MSVEFGREYSYRHGITVRYDYLNDEAVMIIQRKDKKAAIGLSHLHRYTNDDYMVAACHMLAERLGIGVHPGTTGHLATVIEQHIDELTGSPVQEEVNPMQTQNDIDRAVEQYGLKINIGGENLLH